jgi:hypothetical protein
MNLKAGGHRFLPFEIGQRSAETPKEKRKETAVFSELVPARSGRVRRGAAPVCSPKPFQYRRQEPRVPSAR